MAKQKYWDGSKWVQVAPSMEEFTSHLADDAAHGIGNKATLLTTNKTSIVAALNELFTNANDGKAAVANAVTAKGVSASPSDTFSALATKIGQISTGRKMASGSMTLPTKPSGSTRIRDIGFKPRTILIHQSDHNNYSEHYAFFSNELGYSSNMGSVTDNDGTWIGNNPPPSFAINNGCFM